MIFLIFLNTRRKSILEDPSQKWIGTYNGMYILVVNYS
jgi:hypothetical protein